MRDGNMPHPDLRVYIDIKIQEGIMGAESIQLGNLTLEELQTVIGWAAAEGWNPGLEDAKAFFELILKVFEHAK